MQVREWKYKDILRISQIEAECFGGEAWNYRMFASGFENENFYGALAEEGEEIIGYGAITIAADTADLELIAVLEIYRNGGVGGKILEDLFRAAKQRGVTKIFLEVRVSNASAMKFYLDNGFKGAYSRTRYYPDGEDCLVMAKEL